MKMVNHSKERTRLTPEQLAEFRAEIVQLQEFHQLAKSIIKNSKGEVLLTALRRGFNAATEVQKIGALPPYSKRQLSLPSLAERRNTFSVSWNRPSLRVRS